MEHLFPEEYRAVEEHLKTVIPWGEPSHHLAYQRLIEASHYSLFSGGKRFRPLLTLLTGQLFDAPRENLLPFVAAVEMIHTYSLVHDDLPCMDNDDLRRGKPTTHRAFSESTALLVGDGMLTQAFVHLARNYTDDLGVDLIEMLGRAAGFEGMVGGQSIDLGLDLMPFTTDWGMMLHRMKTGALISAAVQGGCMIAKSSDEDFIALRSFGDNLGLAFQLADDIEDHHTDPKAGHSLTRLNGVEWTKNKLWDCSELAKESLRKFDSRGESLRALVEFNFNRI